LQFVLAGYATDATDLHALYQSDSNQSKPIYTAPYVASESE